MKKLLVVGILLSASVAFSQVKVASPSMTTAQLQALLNSAASSNQPVHFPAGTYSLTASGQVTGDVPFSGALQLLSNLNIQCDPGAILQLAAGQSTDANPKDIALFYSGQSVSHVSIHGCTLDMNYPHNKISPKRGTSYNLYPFAHLRVAGKNAALSDSDFENNSFINGPGATCIALAQSNIPGSTLGERVTIAHNLFKNNGMDVGDYSCIYAWANNVSIYDNVFTQDVPAPIESPFHGTFMAFEIHGANSSFHDNQVINYGGGGYIANNYTSPVQGTDIHDNRFKTSCTGIMLFNSNAPSKGVSDAKIHDNSFDFIDHPYPGHPPVQVGIDIEASLPVSNIEVTHNQFAKTGGNSIGASAFRAAPPRGVTYTGLVFSNNIVTGLSAGAEIMTSQGGTIGSVEISHNKFLNLTRVAGFGADGIFVNAENGIDNLSLDGNSFINNAGSSFMYGIYVAKGNVTNLYHGPQTYQGLTNGNYNENSVRVMNRTGNVR